MNMKKVFDVKPYLSHNAFKQLNDKVLFNTVKIDGLSISWLNGADICPDELYNNSKSISDCVSLMLYMFQSI